MIDFQCLKYRFKYNYFIFNYPKCHFCHILSQKTRQKPQKPRQKLPTAKNLPRPFRFRLDQKLPTAKNLSMHRLGVSFDKNLFGTVSVSICQKPPSPPKTPKYHFPNSPLFSIYPTLLKNIKINTPWLKY